MSQPDLFEPSRAAPSELGPEGRRVWDAYMACHPDGTPCYKYGIGETLLLTQMCRMYDRIARVREDLAVAEAEGTLFGFDAKGTPVEHKGLALEVRMLTQIAALASKINLPPLDSAAANPSGEKTLREHQAAAGRARWGYKATTG